MTSILEGPGTAGGTAERPADPAVAGACPDAQPSADSRAPADVPGSEPGHSAHAGATPQPEGPGQPPQGSGESAHAVVAFTRSLAGALDRLADVPAWSMTPAEQRQALVELRRQQARFRLPALHAALLRKAVQALTAPRRIGQGRLDPDTQQKLPASTLAGQGLMELLEHHLDLGGLPSRNGSPFRLVVTIPVEQLCTGLGVAATDVGVRISAGEARRLACAAGILPMVLDGASVPLDLGRERRLPGMAQWLGEAAGPGSVKAPSQATRRQRHQRRGGAQATGDSRRTQQPAHPHPTITWPTTPNPGPCTPDPTEESASTDARELPGALLSTHVNASRVGCRRRR